MRLTWLGHATFLLETTDGIRIVTDPVDEESGYPFAPVACDLVTVSHQHHDHNALHRVSPNAKAMQTTGRMQYRTVTVTGYPTWHDEQNGALRGNNIVFVIEAEGKRIVHLGDLGHMLPQELMKTLRYSDVLLIPVGGTYTLDGRQAAALADQLQAKRTIAMHYQTEHLTFPLSGAEPFLESVHVPAEALRVGETVEF